MSARRKLIAELSEDSLGGIATLQDVDRATQLVDAHRTEVLAEARATAAAEQLVDDTDHPNDLAYNQAIDDVVTALTRLADREPDSTPLTVSRFDTAIEPAPEEPQVLTVGCITEDGRPVALLLDVEARAKVAGWLAPADRTVEFENYPGELAMLRGLLSVLQVTAKHGDLTQVQQLLREHASDEAAAYAEAGEGA